MKQSETLTSNIQTNQMPSSNISTDPEIVELQKQLLLMQMDDLREKKAEKDAKKNDLLRFQLSRRDEIKALADKKRFEQDSCSHQKPNGYAALDGQKDSLGRMHLICNFCNKEFDGIESIPSHLKRTIDPERIGGYA